MNSAYGAQLSKGVTAEGSLVNCTQSSSKQNACCRNLMEGDDKQANLSFSVKKENNEVTLGKHVYDIWLDTM